MSWAETLMILLGLLLGSFATGLPVFIVFFAICIGAVFMLFGSNGFGLVANSILTATSIVSLSAVAMFVLMGDLLFCSRSTEVLFDAANRIFGRLRGRLYFLVIALSTIFGALSGSIVAVTAMLGRSVLPSMNQRTSAATTKACRSPRSCQARASPLSFRPPSSSSSWDP